MVWEHIGDVCACVHILVRMMLTGHAPSPSSTSKRPSKVPKLWDLPGPGPICVRTGLLRPDRCFCLALSTRVDLGQQRAHRGDIGLPSRVVGGYLSFTGEVIVQRKTAV